MQFAPRSIQRLLHNKTTPATNGGFPTLLIMSKLQQLQVAFVPEQDRLLMRVSTQDAQEFRFWLTRRFVNLLYPALKKELARQTHIAHQPSAEARRELLAFEHEKVKQSADFSTPYSDTHSRTLPLGEEPMLLTRFRLQNQASSATRLLVAGPKDQTVNLNLNAELVHSLIVLLDSAVSKADWNLRAAPDSRATDEPRPAVYN